MKCDYCPRKAIANFQKVWEEFRITPDGDYQTRGVLPDQDPHGSDNRHVCTTHRKAFLDGTL